MSLFKVVPITIALAVSGIAATALADGHADKALAAAVKARQSQMTLQSFNLGLLGAMAKGEAPYDAAAAAGAAANLHAAATLDASMMWPEGTAQGSIDGSRALPEIWADFPGVGAKAGDLKTATEAMAAAAGTDLAALQAAIGPVGAACGACHKAYRGKDN